MTISSDLRWHNHVSYITAKASRTLVFVRRNVYNCPLEVKSLAYTSLIRPQLEYASAAWDPYLIGDIQQLEKVQHRQNGSCFATTNTLSLLLVYWSASSGHYSPPDVQTPDSHCSTKQYTFQPVFLFITFRSPNETPDQQSKKTDTNSTVVEANS